MRDTCVCLLPAPAMTSLQFMNLVREHELAAIAAQLPRDGRVLEVGAGSGRQALALADRGFDVTAIDVASSDYAQVREFPIIDYDGARLPFSDASFDAVFSSNVLEHIGDLPRFHREARRVLKPQGRCIHVLPTHVWRTASTLAAYPKALMYLGGARSWGDGVRGLRKLARAVFQTRHGERGNFVSETWYFRPAWWRHNFTRNGFAIVHEEPLGLFYTAEEIRGVQLGVEQRQRWARRIGSSTHLFVLEANP